MSNEVLATYANYALYSAVGVLTLAMIAYAIYLAGAVPASEREVEVLDADEQAAAERARARAERVAARLRRDDGTGSTAITEGGAR